MQRDLYSDGKSPSLAVAEFIHQKYPNINHGDVNLFCLMTTLHMYQIGEQSADVSL